MDIFFRVLIWLVAVAAVDVGGGYVADPHSIYEIDENSVFSGDIRNHAARALKVSKSDCVIVGTSMMSNVSLPLIRDKHDMDCINVSMLGASLYERLLVLRYALALERFTTVILSLDYFGSYGEANPSVQLKSYEFLYDNSHLNDVKFYLGFKWVGPALRNFFSHSGGVTSKDVWHKFDNAVRWDRPEELSRFGGLDNWILDESDSSSKTAVESLLSQLESCLDYKMVDAPLSVGLEDSQVRLLNELSDLLITNQNVTFIGIVPPYSILKRALDLKCEPRQHARFMDELSGLVSVGAQFRNFSIHGFDGELFVGDLSNYKDTRHYSPYIGDQIVDMALQGRNQITENNVKQYGIGIVRKADAYNIGMVKSQLAAMLAQYE